MAVVECELSVDDYGGNLNYLYKDETITETWKVKCNSAHRNLPSLITQCHALQPEFPLRGVTWPVAPSYGLYAKNYTFRMIGGGFKNYEIDVSYQPRTSSEPNTESSAGNPLMWPAIYALDWIEYQEAVTEAYNLEELGADTAWGARAVNTLGPVVNGALQEFEEGIFETQRDVVIHITKNVPNLATIVNYHNTYVRTTNNTSFLGAGQYQAKYLSATSGGEKYSEGFTYYPMTISVQITKTTDRKMNNIGWHYWKQKDANSPKKLVKFMVQDTDEQGNPTDELTPASEPTFLTRGGKIGFAGGWVTYRYLRATSYNGLLL